MTNLNAVVLDWIVSIIGYFALLAGAFVAAMSSVVIVYYTKRRHRYIPHIAVMAGSYSILCVIVALTINYRIFYSGTSRFIGAVAALIAYCLGIGGLLFIFNRRKQTVLEKTDAPNR